MNGSIAISTLMLLPVTTTIVIVGCGPARLIHLFLAETGCRFPVYTDPSGTLYAELGMIYTGDLGPRPDYQRTVERTSLWQRFWQVFKLPLYMYNSARPTPKFQVGGEFLFEPLTAESPISITGPDGEFPRLSPIPPPGFRAQLTPADGEDKIVTWCHRMRNLRDHIELPELHQVLGMRTPGEPGPDLELWEKAMNERKGVGESWMQDTNKWHMQNYLNPSWGAGDSFGVD